MIRSISEAMSRALEKAIAGADRATVEAGLTDDDRDAEVRRRIAEREGDERAQELRKRAVILQDTGAFPAMAIKRALAPAETSAMQNARGFLQTRRRVLVLAGAVGTGKTVAATWIALEAGGSSAAFISASELESRGRYDKELKSWLRACSMLVIDDLGAEVLDGKGVFRSFLDEIVDVAYRSQRLLVVTTNMLPRREQLDDELQFIERYGDRIASRLSEVGTWASCGTRDLRRDQLKLVPRGDS